MLQQKLTKVNKLVLVIGVWARLYCDILSAFSPGQVVTIKAGPKASQQHLTHRQAALIPEQPLKDTSFMVEK